MDKYMASQIILKKLDYVQLFAITRWQSYKENVNKLLQEAGREDLIQN